jgi:hypothetical protein
MSSAYSGRSRAYATALESGNTGLIEALRRNLYRGAEVDARLVAAVADYVVSEAKRLETLSFDRFLSGELGFAATLTETARQ